MIEDICSIMLASLYTPVFLYECEYCNQTPCPCIARFGKNTSYREGAQARGARKDAYSLNGGLYSLIQIVLVVICVRLFWSLFVKCSRGGAYKTVIKMSLVMYIGGGHPPQIIGEDYLIDHKKEPSLIKSMVLLYRACAKVFENVILHTHARKFLKLLLQKFFS